MYLRCCLHNQQIYCWVASYCTYKLNLYLCFLIYLQLKPHMLLLPPDLREFLTHINTLKYMSLKILTSILYPNIFLELCIQIQSLTCNFHCTVKYKVTYCTPIPISAVTTVHSERLIAVDISKYCTHHTSCVSHIAL